MASPVFLKRFADKYTSLRVAQHYSSLDRCSIAHGRRPHNCDGQLCPGLIQFRLQKLHVQVNGAGSTRVTSSKSLGDGDVNTIVCSSRPSVVCCAHIVMVYTYTFIDSTACALCVGMADTGLPVSACVLFVCSLMACNTISVCVCVARAIVRSNVRAAAV